MKNIAIINGPNLNLLGKREPKTYGAKSFETYFEILKKKYLQFSLHYFQSNNEGDLIDYMHKIGFSYSGIILNAGAYTHTSVALYDAIKSIETPVLEVHISNIHKREKFRQHSYISPAAKGIVIGFGFKSYALALESFLE